MWQITALGSIVCCFIILFLVGAKVSGETGGSVVLGGGLQNAGEMPIVDD